MSATAPPETRERVSFQTHPDRYRHWRLVFDHGIARLTMAVDPAGGLRPGYELKLNSYDLGVDIELADAIQRIRFEHPETRCLVIDAALDKVFCAGANIPMLRSSAHGWKVNFCKFTNETRLALEDLSENSGIPSLAACNGATAGGGYELALACDRILLVDDSNSSVSLPEVPLLAVLPGTGGLTRLVDKRMVRRDRADVFCTLVEGIKGRKALEWGLVDAIAPPSRFAAERDRLAEELAAGGEDRSDRRGVELKPLEREEDENSIRWRHVNLALDRPARTAELIVTLPDEAGPEQAEAIRAAGSDWWYFRALRELDEALLELRINEPGINLVLLRVRGSVAVALAADAIVAGNEDDWFVREVRLFAKRVLKRLDMTAKSFFALADQGTAFAGTWLETALAADRLYVLDDPEAPVELGVSTLNGGALPMGNGLSRLETRFLGEPERAAAVLERLGPIPAAEADELGLATAALDEIDWEDEVRVYCEERASYSPDALTGMEANLRFAGPETLETKIFGRLTAWQNWIFQRPNAVGATGALQCYGTPQRPEFDYTRT
ncbi:MAG: benzoyl-CoA-dihydrodiol lyase [Planctomycetota bacterium]|nr:MAG: benzoyl-CoA-dihydrodiol lyase [Planctomycetota bacterium]